MSYQHTHQAHQATAEIKTTKNKSTEIETQGIFNDVSISQISASADAGLSYIQHAGNSANADSLSNQRTICSSTLHTGLTCLPCRLAKVGLYPLMLLLTVTK